MVFAPFALDASQKQVYAAFSQLSLPRHTSYPGVPAWSEDLQEAAYGEMLGKLGDMKEPVSLYVHIPFCEKLCHYCACTKLIVPKNNPSSDDYVGRLMRGLRSEIRHVRSLTGPLSATQVHFGGGTPTYLEPTLLDELYQMLEESFPSLEKAERAVEVDPRVTTEEHLRVMRRHGVTRLSLGVQDFDPEVQRLVNRIQPFSMVRSFVAMCRELGFTSLNFDLIYGLPQQSIASMERTIDIALELSPDRIAYYRLAVIPEIFKWQRLFSRGDMPDFETTLALNLLAINRFREAGYRFIGLDHFAKPEEALTQAYEEGTLTRSFQGMTTGSELNLLGFGPTAIGQPGASFVQNEKDLFKWLRSVDSGSLATVRGYRLTQDDEIRRFVIQRIYCYRRVDFAFVENLYGINFASYFEDELARLRDLTSKGIVRLSRDSFALTEPLGLLLSRVVASVFDVYLPKNAYKEGLASTAASRVG